jgi:hypothetical protein
MDWQSIVQPDPPSESVAPVLASLVVVPPEIAVHWLLLASPHTVPSLLA